MLAAIYGGKNTQDGWRIRTGKEAEMIYKEVTITTVIKFQRLNR